TRRRGSTGLADMDNRRGDVLVGRLCALARTRPSLHLRGMGAARVALYEHDLFAAASSGFDAPLAAHSLCRVADTRGAPQFAGSVTLITARRFRLRRSRSPASRRRFAP